jgi:hypothetical protein
MHADDESRQIADLKRRRRGIKTDIEGVPLAELLDTVSIRYILNKSAPFEL